MMEVGGKRELKILFFIVRRRLIGMFKIVNKEEEEEERGRGERRV